MKTSSKSLIKLLVCNIFLLTAFAGFSQNEEKTTETTESGSPGTEFFKGGMKVEKVGDDSLVIHIKKHDCDDFSWNGCSFMHKKGKYNGHWAGIDLGWNGYVNEDFNMTYPADEQYLNLKSSRSMTVNLNPIEFNLNLVKNHFFVTLSFYFRLVSYKPKLFRYENII